jgi:hypothetical protein
MTTAAEPRMPSHVRLARPDLWRSGVTGRLTAEARDFYLGLSTLADDDGWLLWRLPEIGATLYAYAHPDTREATMADLAAALQDAELLVIHQCACAHLPRIDDVAVTGGRKTHPVHDYHRSGHTGTYAAGRVPLVLGSDVLARDGAPAAASAAQGPTRLGDLMPGVAEMLAAKAPAGRPKGRANDPPTPVGTNAPTPVGDDEGASDVG